MRYAVLEIFIPAGKTSLRGLSRRVRCFLEASRPLWPKPWIKGFWKLAEVSEEYYQSEKASIVKTMKENEKCD